MSTTAMNGSRNLLVNFIFFILIIIIYIYFEESKNASLKANDKFGKESNVQKIMKNVYRKLVSSERSVYSKKNVDGVIETIFQFIKIKNLQKTYVEIGAGSGHNCTTRYLREHKQWSGVLFDPVHTNYRINLQKQKIHYANVIEVFKKFNVPKDFDLLAINSVYGDYWILDQILSNKYLPNVVVHEINQQPLNECETVLRNGSRRHNLGTSMCAFYCLAQKYDYTMIYCESAGLNCFWVKNEYVKSSLKFEVKFFQKVLNITTLYKEIINKDSNGEVNRYAPLNQAANMSTYQIRKCY